MSKKTLEPARHEPSDVPPIFMWSGAGALALTVSLTALVVFLLFPGSMADRSMRLPLPTYPKPRLQQQPSTEMAQFYREEMSRLNGAGWVDEAQGVAHIPIAVAMRKIAEEKIPDWPGVAEQAPVARGPQLETKPTAGESAEKAHASALETPGPRPAVARPPGARACDLAGGPQRGCLSTKTRRPASAGDHAPRRTWRPPSRLRAF